jgi:uncharacterized SAM-binding protein YcdF (DUF218 family)
MLGLQGFFAYKQVFDASCSITPRLVDDRLKMIKPLLTALVLPPLAPLLLAALGWLLAVRKKRGGLTLIALALVMSWLLSCHGTAVLLGRHALKQYEAATSASLAAAQVQAIIILGGGVQPEAPEYGEAQLRADTAARLRYGLRLARQTGLPVGFSGGIGWAATQTQTQTEAEVAQRVALQDYGATLRWAEGQSRDTAENAQRMHALLRANGIDRIALVTHASHMPRAEEAFVRTGLQVVPAPTGFVLPAEHALLEWLPSGQGAMACRTVLREWLGLQVAQLTAR